MGLRLAAELVVVGLGGISLGQCGIHFVERALHQRRVFLRAGDRDGFRGLEDPAHHRDVEDLVVHDEAHRARDRRREDQRVHVADVVAHDQRSAFVGHIGFDAVQAQPVQAAHHHPAEEAHQEFTSKLNEKVLKEIVALIPEDWLQWEDNSISPDEIRNVYFQFLATRLQNADLFLKQAQDARKILI